MIRIHGNVTPIDSSVLIDQFGLGESGDTQRFWTQNIVAKRMRKYLPLRQYGHVIKALGEGITDNQIEIAPTGSGRSDSFGQYLYYGRVMEGVPRKPTNRDLVYTTDINAQAGPYWDRRLLEMEDEEMTSEVTSYIRGRGQ